MNFFEGGGERTECYGGGEKKKPFLVFVQGGDSPCAALQEEKKILLPIIDQQDWTCRQIRRRGKKKKKRKGSGVNRRSKGRIISLPHASREKILLFLALPVKRNQRRKDPDLQGREGRKGRRVGVLI